MPMPHGSTEEDFFAKLDEALAAIKLFQPDALILALGFDIYKNDRSTGQGVSLFRRVLQAQHPCASAGAADAGSAGRRLRSGGSERERPAVLQRSGRLTLQAAGT
eukprot:CAMPEP_0181259432 /NCGR_PEP_ID=MMETSP1097-20121128/411_1 /TAXON_ID=35684 /ORGANISM="Pseudopedinella elastica, Strain CCMP716" /LENGTH=104 /DNA_ID=CAMNT_0023357887 /DNA_START=45 /DNA_END=359 /DNA_ORIENTATION=+